MPGSTITLYCECGVELNLKGKSLYVLNIEGETIGRATVDFISLEKISYLIRCVYCLSGIRFSRNIGNGVKKNN